MVRLDWNIAYKMEQINYLNEFAGLWGDGGQMDLFPCYGIKHAPNKSLHTVKLTSSSLIMKNVYWSASVPSKINIPNTHLKILIDAYEATST